MSDRGDSRLLLAPVELATRFPIYPAIFAGAFVLSAYLGTYESPQVIARPFAALMLGIVALQVTIGILARDRHLGALGAATAFGLAFEPIIAVVVLAAANTRTVLALARRQRIPRLDTGALAVPLTVISGIALALNIAPATERALLMAPLGPDSVEGVDRPLVKPPDIFVVLLDGYPRADTLADGLGFDNRPFLQHLESMGFEVAEDSHSNYNATLLSLTSIFNSAHVPELMSEPPAPPLDSAELVRRTNGGSGLVALRQAGYRVTTISSGITQASISAADAPLDTGHITLFETGMLREGWLPYVLPGIQRSWLLDQQRARISESLRLLASLASDDAEQPRFNFLHVMAPHEPFVFNADGSAAPELDCVPQTCTPWATSRGPSADRALVEQVAYLNQLVTDAVETILAHSDAPPVIVILSDHGSRRDLSDRQEMFRNLLVAFTPDRPGLFPDSATPINLIPRLLNEYADAEMALASEESYVFDLGAIESAGYFPLVRFEVDP